MERKVLLLVMLACITKLTFCADYYSIVGSKTIKPNSQYAVAVSLLEAAKSASIKVTIQSDKGFKATNSVLVQPGTSQLVQFAIGKLDQGNYKLVAEGPSGLPFVKEIPISFPWKNESIFVQTDKAMYKPGDKVKFRVLVLDSDLNPGTVNKMDVYITDSGNNKIKQWLNVATSLGVYNQELQLAKNPPLGAWKINVDVNNEKRSKEFDVYEYVLPKFDVSVSAPKDATYSDSLVRVTFSAKYTYGENVKGTAKVSVAPSGSVAVAEKNVDISGSGYVEFQMSELKVNVQNYENIFDVTVRVTETLTGNIIEDGTTLSVRKTKFSIKDLDNEPKYTPGVSFPLMLQVAYHDGSPFINTNSRIKVSYGSSNTNKNDIKYLNSGYMDANGLAKIDITLPATANNGVYIYVQFLEFFEPISFYNKNSPKIFSDQYSISATLMTKNAKVNDEISILISSPQPLSYINYLLTSRGKLISSVRDDVWNQDTFTIEFIATFEMVPSVKLVAYYLLSSGEVVSTNIDIPVTGLNNFVDVRTSAAEKQPGEKVDIYVSSKASSTVCLLGVDQSVILLKSGNDIVHSDVYSELRGFNQYPQASGSWQNFESANLFILTNAFHPPILIDEGFSSFDKINGLMKKGSFNNELAIMPPPSSKAIQPRVRKFFPETWLWSCKPVGSGNLTISETAPDTITSWHITGFATNTKFGLGVTEDKTAFKVFKKFFISLNLPYSIIRGETIALSIVVFNYMPQSVTATVTLDNSRKEFEFADPFTQIYKDKGCPQAIELSRKKNVNALANNGVEVVFFITPLVTGPIRIKVTATSAIAGDAIEVLLPVVAEGVTQYKNTAVLVDLRQNKTFTRDLTAVIPANAVKDSEKVSFSIIGEFMGVTIQTIVNHNNIIRYPCGCGEQNMIGLAPDVVILVYLTKIGKLTPELKILLIQYLEIGYQGQLSYLRTDGSFSAFGMSDSCGSTWLTAFVIRIFIQASEFTCIDNNIISRGLEWLKNRQQPDGSFPEVGRVIHWDMQGLAQEGVALTAYVVIAFAQAPASAIKYADVITKALSFLKTKLGSCGDIYALAIACYAAHLANHESKVAFLQKIDQLAKVEGEFKYWEKVKLPTDPWYFASSVNVEITSYVLLSYLKAGRIFDAASIAKWLLSQQSSYGGYASTQDTLMAITALAAYSADLASVGTGAAMTCVLKYGASQSTLKIDQNNLQVLQSVELPDKTKSVKLTCTGSGTALAQLSYQFNLNTIESSPRFDLKVDIDPKSNDFLLMLNICTSYIPIGDDNKSNMAIVEVELPSGFTADLALIEETVGSKADVKKIETKNANTVVVIYLDNVSANQICLKVIAYRICQIADQRPVAVQVYDYYNTARRKTVFYQIKTKGLCGICVENDCKESCKKPVKDVTCPKKA
ncbi:CD109 antigen [Pseudolycoriella hygida]|uniref:TEP1-F n=1 Tax=Pseudolycoriella hygida TaxID=35572 RepID=A0A9Q0N2F4_9DIPT|nr:CD109 antigen [Pseudolycoriella hygida]